MRHGANATVVADVCPLSTARHAFHAVQHTRRHAKGPPRAALPTSSRRFPRSALARLETRVALADHEHLAATTHDLAVAMALLGGFERGQNLHGKTPGNVQTQMYKPLIISACSRQDKHRMRSARASPGHAVTFLEFVDHGQETVQHRAVLVLASGQPHHQEGVRVGQLDQAHPRPASPLAPSQAPGPRRCRPRPGPASP